jgi:putative ABC transport system substrate-binding protein
VIRTTRRAFLSTLALTIAGSVLPERSAAQDNVPRIGVLVFRSRAVSRLPEVFPRALRELGYVDGQNIRLEFRYADGREDRVDAIAGEMVRRRFDVIVSEDTPSALALKKATTTIPIVMISGDPVGTGIVASLARPGGNITGAAGTGAEIAGKSLQLFQRLLPGATRMAMIASGTDPFATPFRAQNRQAAQALKIELHDVVVNGPAEVEAALAELVKKNVKGVIVQGSLATPHLAQLAINARLPTTASSTPFARAGGLMSYAPDRDNVYEQMASYVDKILKGAKPADLPIQRPRKFELVINLKTAKVLGLTVPPALLAEADEVIQ